MTDTEAHLEGAGASAAPGTKTIESWYTIETRIQLLSGEWIWWSAGARYISPHDARAGAAWVTSQARRVTRITLTKEVIE
jgi:hypothetical protein